MKVGPWFSAEIAIRGRGSNGSSAMEGRGFLVLFGGSCAVCRASGARLSSSSGGWFGLWFSVLRAVSSEFFCPFSHFSHYSRFSRFSSELGSFTCSVDSVYDSVYLSVYYASFGSSVFSAFCTSRSFLASSSSVSTLFALFTQFSIPFALFMLASSPWSKMLSPNPKVTH